MEGRVMDGMFYYQADHSIHADFRLLRLNADYGLEGIGLYWSIIGLMAPFDGMNTCNYNVIAHTLNTTEDLVKEVVECYDLFEIDGDIFKL